MAATERKIMFMLTQAPNEQKCTANHLNSTSARHNKIVRFYFVFYGLKSQYQASYFVSFYFLSNDLHPSNKCGWHLKLSFHCDTFLWFSFSVRSQFSNRSIRAMVFVFGFVSIRNVHTTSSVFCFQLLFE